MLRQPISTTSRLPAAITLVRHIGSDNFNKSPRLQEQLEAAKKRLKWRSEPGEKPGAWMSKFKLFGNDNQTSDLISLMQQPIDLSPGALSKWWQKRNERLERHMQMYLPERHQILGSDLASAHFILFRGGSVKFLNQKNWIQADENREFNLPDRFDPRYKLEAIKCDNMTLYYEGLENLRRLQNLKFLSFRNVKTFDDWCLDRVSGAENPKLEVLDISGTGITYRGLSALYRLENLKVLVVDDPKVSKEFELSCAMLEEFRPKLQIKAASEIHDD